MLAETNEAQASAAALDIEETIGWLWVPVNQAQCRGVAYDCYGWPSNPRTYQVAHNYIATHWSALSDGDVIDVEFILGETDTRKTSERYES